MVKIEEIEKTFREYEERIKKLKKLEERLKRLDAEGFEEDVEKIIKEIKNPEKVEKIEKQLDELERKIEYRKELKNRIEEAEEFIERHKDLLEDESIIEDIKNAFENKDYEFVEELLRQIEEDFIRFIAEWENLEEIYNGIKEKIVIPDKIEKKIIEIREKVKDRKFEEALDSTAKIKEEIKQIVKNAQPILQVDIPTKKAIQNKWKKLKVKIKNVGNVMAKNIKVALSAELDYKKIAPFDLKPGEEKEVEIYIKPLESGEVPLEVSLEYKGSELKEDILKKLDVTETKLNDTFAITKLFSLQVVEESTKYPVTRPSMPKIKARIHDIYKETQEISYPYGDFFSYEIVDKIGSGGFCNVYLVRKKGNNEEYAMKIPKGIDMSGGETLFLQEKDLKTYGKEANIWAMLTEKLPDDVINLIDAGIQPFPWFVMELADESLRQKMKKMDEEEKISLIIELLRKLDKVHHFGVVHRDLKPENILFVEDKAKLTDFGLAKIVTKSSRSGVSSGTPDYMAPEQISKKKFGDIDWRTDIWQMGVIAYELLAGETPFKGEGYEEIGMAILFEEPLPLTEFGYDEKLSNAIMKALQKKKEERYQSALEFMNELRRIK